MRSKDLTPPPPPPQIVIKTSGNFRIPVDSTVLASASPVFENLIDQRRWRAGKLNKPIPVLGVPSDAVVAFVRFLSSSSFPTPTLRCTSLEHADMMDRYAMHLMVLSHAYRVKWLKDMCEAELALRITADSVVDVLQLARQCDVPKLYHQCMKLLRKDFAAVQKTEAWIFMQNNDPWLELEILQFLDEYDLRNKQRRRKTEEQKVYLQLSEAMECLQHICTEGCTSVGPFEAKDPPSKHKALSCPNYTICSALQNLIRHLASCRTQNRSACPQCRRIWDLLHLHSSICELTHHCKVPLCKQFKLRMQMEGKGEHDGRWRLLAKKVGSVKVMAALAKRRKQDVGTRVWDLNCSFTSGSEAVANM